MKKDTTRSTKKGKEGTRSVHKKKSTKVKIKPAIAKFVLDGVRYLRSRSGGIIKVSEDKTEVVICSYVQLVAHLTHEKTQSVTVKVEFACLNGNLRHAFIPPSEFNNGKAVASYLQDLGLRIDDMNSTKEFLTALYKHRRPRKNILSVSQPGWYMHDIENVMVYVINGKTFTPEGKTCNIVLDESVNAGFATNGSSEGWSKNIATKCIGNSRLTLMVCASLLGPALKLMGIQNFGLHICGSTKSAKTTCLIVARSIFGDQYYGYSWNATTGALQETARSRNHAVLFLDEISQCDAKEVSRAVYDLMNGVSKNRLAPDCRLNSVTRNSMVVISTGEYSLQEHLHQGGIKVKPGQLVRLPSIPVSTAKGMFSNLHGEPTLAALALKLRASAEDNYGTIGFAWIQHLVDKQVELKATFPARVKIIQTQLIKSIKVDELTEAQRDVAKCMAAIACTGEEAISCGIMPWPEGTAIKAAKYCFKVWYRHETGEAIKREPFPAIKKFFIENRENFLPLAQFAKNGDTLAYTHETNGVDVFLLPVKKSKTALFKQFGEKEVVAELKRRDLLALGSGDRPTKQLKIPGSDIQKQGFYVIRSSILASK